MLPGNTPDLALVTGTGGGSSPPYSGGSLDTQTVVSGADGTAVNANRRRGFIIGSMGSCSNGNSALYSGAVIRELASEEDDGATINYDTIFTVTGVVANSGWTTMTVGGLNTVLQRANASFSTSSGNSTWTWFQTGNLFGGATSSHIVGFS